jgi:hypothetical protein
MGPGQRLHADGNAGFRPSLDQALAELTAFSIEDIRLPDFNPEDLQVIVRKSPKGKERKKLLDRRPRVLGRRCTELEWSVNLTLTKYHVTRSDGRSIPLAERISIWKQVASEEFASRVISILVASHIARPGVLRTNDVEIWIEKEFLKVTEGVSGFFGEIVEFAGEKSWPVIESLSIKQVWKWMCRFQQLPENLGQSEIERALNAFSYLLAQKPIGGVELVDLMWAMIGLEALYGRGTSDLTYQLVEKAGVLLGRSSGFEKSVKEMYHFRSMFIHGKMPFPGVFFAADATPAYERHSDKAYDVSFLAAATLVASLQQIAKRNWTSLSFSFVFNEPNDEP